MKLKKRLFGLRLLCVTLLVMALIGCGSTTKGEDASDNVDTDGNINTDGSTNTDADAATDLQAFNEEAYNEMSQKVKLVGRVYVNDDGTVWCGHSGTGMEFTYSGSHLDITFAGDASIQGSNNGKARVAVYVNEERVLDTMISKVNEEFTVFESDQPQDITVRIVKLSESSNSTVGIRSIEVADGETIAPTQNREHRIEFIGDSITCGYGVDDENRDHHFSTETEDATKTYAYQTAQMLNADYSFVSFSGYGIISGYTNNSSVCVSEQTLPQYYASVGFSYQKFAGTIAPQDVAWDFSNFTPDAIVINLGTNDSSYCGNDADKKVSFSAGYVEFLKQLRKQNSDAVIFCTLGVMGDSLYASIETAVEQYTTETGDMNVHCVKLPVQDGSTGYAADWHPTEATHTQAAEVLTQAIRDTMGW